MNATPATPSSVLIVGNDGGTNIGASLYRAARSRGLDATLLDARQAFAAPRLIARWHWWMNDRRPARLEAFGARVLAECHNRRPDVVLATGLAPLDRPTLEGIEKLGIARINYLTDDPWNRASRSRWFLEALPLYDHIWSPRTGNLDDLRRHGCQTVDYLPFGFDPELFFPDPPADTERNAFETDVCFAGGADADRVPYMSALLGAGLKLSLYGDYWNRYSSTRVAAQGHADPATLRKAAAGAAISLCLVRRANRDGHTMRSIEVPAARGCMLAEDTTDHRAFFGPSGLAVVYFQTAADLVDIARQLLRDPNRRRALAAAAHTRITSGGYTYGERLVTMLAGARG